MIPAPSLDPFSWYHKMQQENPVVFDGDYIHLWGEKGVWHVFRYEDVKRVYGDYENFSSEVTPRMDNNPIANSITNLDPPRHRSLRKIISKAFVPSVISNLEPWIRQLCTQLWEKHLESEKIEFIRDFAIPVPVRVICQLLGVPDQNHEQISHWAKAFTSNPQTEEEVGYFFQAQQEQMEYFTALIEQRYKEPKDDLISSLIAAEVDGERLSTEDLISFAMILLFAGNETTTNLLGNAIYTLTEHPEMQEHLFENREDIPQAIDEVLRYRSPVQSLFRKAKHDIELGGKRIKQGDYVSGWIGAANHDPSIFEQPGTFDIYRDNQAKLSFGHGIHYCIGAPLAILEAKIALDIILERATQLQLEPNTSVDLYPSSIMYGFQKLPLVFQKRT
ncbi:Cytochrome P450 [Seinonella peptonophila]|uniref:Cytochrome P450 n=1 Tax=Seinonella peptonophila TaxID=112248 RepID=A0A1M4U0J0_9BACL|nr:cytochrome P450 [Seinonella peptonophila]SHE50096.1 Cytochrome P450 [Seinonella peptonophila]